MRSLGRAYGVTSFVYVALNHFGLSHGGGEGAGSQWLAESHLLQIKLLALSL